jgi:hypothetical protein
MDDLMVPLGVVVIIWLLVLLAMLWMPMSHKAWVAIGLLIPLCIGLSRLFVPALRDRIPPEAGLWVIGMVFVSWWWLQEKELRETQV